MKRSSTFIFVLSILWTACSDSFFETSPATQITTPEVFTSETNIDAFINGSIRYLMENSTSQDNPGLPAIFLTHEVMGEDAFARENRYGYRDSYPYKDPYDNTTRRCLFFWTLQYTSINHANNLIANIAVGETGKASLKHLKGQAYALRAFNYLNIVRQYQFTYKKNPDAPVAPIYTDPTTGATDPRPRATVQQVYDLVLSDLKEAERLLSGYNRPSKDRPDLNVVYGLLARTYLTLEKWNEAALYASKARQGYPLMNPEQYEGFNNADNPEWIWGHLQTRTQHLGASYLGYIETTPYTVNGQGVNVYSGYNSIMPDPYFVETFEDGDVRKSLFEIERNPSDAQMYQHWRYKKFHNLYPDEDGDIVLMRSSEQLLIEAESKVRLNQTSDAVSLLNELRVKRNLPPLSAVNFTQETLIANILLERRHELWGEGFRLYDILRTQTAPVRRFPSQTFVDAKDDTKDVKGHWIIKFPDGSDLSPDSEYFLFPIPLNEINNNPSL
jgi:hypothetical protein